MGNQQSGFGPNAFLNATIRHNVIVFPGTSIAPAMAFNNCLVESNIIRMVHSGTRNSVFRNNVVFEPQSTDSTFLGENTFIDNVWDVNQDFVFTDTGAFDARFQLAEGSPARGAGVDGADAGAYGGDLPYQPSGGPQLPRVKIMAPPPLIVSPGSDLTIPIKVTVE